MNPHILNWNIERILRELKKKKICPVFNKVIFMHYEMKKKVPETKGGPVVLQKLLDT